MIKGLDKFLREVKKIVVDVGDYIARNFEKFKKVEFKSRRDPVTHIDRNSEQKIRDYLKKKFPQIPFVGEEIFSSSLSEGLYWLVDPLDGTVNFQHKFPVFCVSCALMLNKEPLVGVVYDPLRKELFWAKKGGRAQLNSKPIKVSNTRKLASALLCTGFYYEFEKMPDTNIEHFVDFLHLSQGVRRTGSAALDLCYVGCGRLDGFWELYLKPWDTAAGSLIVKESGGKISKFDGSPYTPFDREILASNKFIHREMVEVLKKRR